MNSSVMTRVIGSLVFGVLAYPVVAASQAKPPARPQPQAASKPGGKAPAPAPTVPTPLPDAKVLAERRREAENRPLFQTNDTLAFTLTADFKAVNNDRDPSSTKTFPATITTTQADGKSVSLALQIAGRGHSRRNPGVCDFIPLRLEFNKDTRPGTVFAGPHTLKLGTHCRGSASFDQYILREYAAYRILNILTPDSFRVRLAKGTYVDAATKKVITTRYAMLLEDDQDVAHRLEGRLGTTQDLMFRHVDSPTVMLMTLFEYMIGNTDVSIGTLHNVRIIETATSGRLTVPYDFDYSGLVNAPYARVDKQLSTLFKIESVRDRLFRGPCHTPAEWEPVFDKVNAARPAINTLLETLPDFTPGSLKDAKGYLDEFYKTINDPRNAKQALIDACVKAGM